MKQSNVEKYAYAAGLFDGEGCVRIAKSQAKKKAKSPQYSLIVKVTQKDGRVMDWLKGNWGGTVLIMHKTNNQDENFRYDWFLNHNNAAKFLKDILPFLKIKKEQTQLALRFQGRLTKSRYKAPEDQKLFAKLSDHEIEIRESMFQEISRLKKVYAKAKTNIWREYYPSMVQAERLSEGTLEKSDAIV